MSSTNKTETRITLAEPSLLSRSPPTSLLACIGPHVLVRAGTPVEVLMRSCWNDGALVRGQCKDGTPFWGWVGGKELHLANGEKSNGKRP